jgi:HSP20 family protein
MLSRWGDTDEMFATMDELRRRMDQLFGDIEAGRRPGTSAWPQLEVLDMGSTLVVKAEVPGLGEDEIKLTIDQDVIAIAGERKTGAPEGYVARRQERAAARFARSFPLPCRVLPEKTSAALANGVLTITMTKAATEPRHINVRAS